MIFSGNYLIENGYPRGRIVGLALEAARRAEGSANESSALEDLLAVRDAPEGFVDDPRYGGVAREWMRLRERSEREDRAEDALRPEPLPHAVYGEEMIEEAARRQMREAMRLPVSVSGALMPDAHVGYGLPIGGVLATEPDVVIPYAIGVDIGCRMRLTVFDALASVLDDGGARSALADALLRNTNFGAGGSYKPGRRGMDHPVLDDPAWDATPFLKKLKGTAEAQLGTSGSGNHFVEWGAFRALEDVPLGGPGAPDGGPGDVLLEGEERLALLSHSGSRGVGARIADRYTRIARAQHPYLEGGAAELAWLRLDAEEGAEYWLSMGLAGRFATANHAVIHAKLARALPEALREALRGGTGEGAVAVSWENHHNFGWRESVGGREAIVHRKGATPAGPGVMGVIPGSMGGAGYVVRGRGNPASLNSASHGAGRRMSRKRAFEEVSEEALKASVERAGVTLIGGSPDEAPAAYKDLGAVLAAQRDLVDLVGSFTPGIVRMDEARQPRWKKKRGRK